MTDTYSVPDKACEELRQAVEIAEDDAEVTGTHDPTTAERMITAARTMCEICERRCTDAMCMGDPESAVADPLLKRIIKQAGYHGLALLSEGDPEEDSRQIPHYWDLPGL